MLVIRIFEKKKIKNLITFYFYNHAFNCLIFDIDLAYYFLLNNKNSVIL